MGKRLSAESIGGWFATGRYPVAETVGKFLTRRDYGRLDLPVEMYRFYCKVTGTDTPDNILTERDVKDFGDQVVDLACRDRIVDPADWALYVAGIVKLARREAATLKKGVRTRRQSLSTTPEKDGGNLVNRAKTAELELAQARSAYAHIQAHRLPGAFTGLPEQKVAIVDWLMQKLESAVGHYAEDLSIVEPQNTVGIKTTARDTVRAAVCSLVGLPQETYKELASTAKKSA